MLPLMDLPRFLICNSGDDTDERCWVLHTQEPRFVVEAVAGGRDALVLFDAGADASSPAVQKAVTAALDWLEGE